MKERPILFSAPMIRALLAGTKTQTRRIMKDQSIGERFSHMTDDGLVHLEWFGDPCCGSGVWDVPEYSANVAAPYGKPGDRLWVRETFMDLRGTGIEHRPDPSGPLQRYAYQANTPPGSHGDEVRKDYGLKWKPSIHMPRAACRILLEITDVRVERLQDISEADAVAEGSFTWAGEQDTPVRDLIEPPLVYRQLWEQINGVGAWDANPWVWVVEFRRLP